MNILITEEGEVLFGYRGNKGKSKKDDFMFGFYISEYPCDQCALGNSDCECEKLKSPHPGYKNMWEFCSEFPSNNIPGHIMDTSRIGPLRSYLEKYGIL